MQANKKLITCSILAIAIGIASIVPLAFFMSPAEAQTNDVPWFNIKATYAYYSTNTDTTRYGSSYTFGFNYTVNPTAAVFANARVEYFQIHIYSDLGSIENITTSFGANCTGYLDPTTLVSFSRNGWFNTTASRGGTFIANFNGTLPANGEFRGGIGGVSTSSYLPSLGLPEEFLNAQNAHTIYVDISRLGYVTFDGNNTIVTLADHAVIQHIELTRNGDYFSFGDVPADRVETINFPKSEP